MTAEEHRKALHLVSDPVIVQAERSAEPLVEIDWPGIRDRMKSAAAAQKLPEEAVREYMGTLIYGAHWRQSEFGRHFGTEGPIT